MATIKDGILGGFSGLVGTVIGATWKSLDVIRKRPKKSGVPPVQSQIDQRFKFKMVLQFILSAKGLVDIGYKSFSKKMSPVNAAVSYHLANAVTGVSPAFTIDYTKVVLGTGTLPDASNMKVVAAAGRTLNFTWDALEIGEDDPTGSVKTLRDTDSIKYLYYNPTLKLSLRSAVGGLRGALKGTSKLATPILGGACHVWVMCQSADGKSISRSQYLGLVTGIA